MQQLLLSRSAEVFVERVEGRNWLTKKREGLLVLLEELWSREPKKEGGLI